MKAKKVNDPIYDELEIVVARHALEIDSEDIYVIYHDLISFLDHFGFQDVKYIIMMNRGFVYRTISGMIAQRQRQLCPGSNPTR